MAPRELSLESKVVLDCIGDRMLVVCPTNASLLKELCRGIANARNCCQLLVGKVAHFHATKVCDKRHGRS